MLTLAAGAYVEHAVYSRGDTATSPLLDGLAVDVASTFDAREQRPPQYRNPSKRTRKNSE